MEVKHFQELLEKAKANRVRFLTPYKERFDAITAELQEAQDENTKRKLFKERARIIIDLIKLEPSHKDESWIAEELTEWLRSHDCSDFVKEAFLAQKGRRRPTEKQQEQWARDFFLAEEVDRLYEQKKAEEKERWERFARLRSDNLEYQVDMGPRLRISRELIFRKLADKSESSRFIPNLDSHYNPDAQIKRAYYRHQKRKKKRELPYPYYGYDITETMLQGRGTKMEIESDGQKITLWGDWKIEK